MILDEEIIISPNNSNCVEFELSFTWAVLRPSTHKIYSLLGHLYSGVALSTRLCLSPSYVELRILHLFMISN